MLKSISTTLITGLFTVLPIVLTIYLLYWIIVSSERVMGTALRFVLPEIFYFPGLGTLVGLVVIFFVGLLMKAVLVRQLFAFGEQILFHVPIIKTVYRAIRDLFEFFSPKKEHFGRVVIVSFNDMQVMGFITQEEPERLPETFRDSDRVLVYIPMSYMIGGFTVFVSKADIKPCQMSMDEAMRFVLTAGITGKKSNAEPARVESA